MSKNSLKESDKPTDEMTAIHERLDELEAENEALREENEHIREQLQTENDALRDRIQAFEESLGEITAPSRAPGLDDSGRDDTGKGTVLFDGSSDTYKILGQLDESVEGIGVLGCNVASTGTTYGVKGEVASSNGFGLYTPNDAKVDGAFNTTGALRAVVGGDEVAQIQSSSGKGTVLFGSPNEIKDGAETATIAGGGTASNPNQVYADSAFLGGGTGNQVGTDDNNRSVGQHGTLAGGSSNTVSAASGTVSGGRNNTITTNGLHGTIPGGRGNTVDGTYSMAAGRRARADFDGNFVWADSTDSDFITTGADQFIVQAGGGVGIGTNGPSTQLDVNGDTTLDGDVTVTGSESITKTSLSVARDAATGSQQIPENGARTKVEFDKINDDDFNGWIDADFSYTIPEDGDYHIDCMLNWLSVANSAVTQMYVEIGGSTKMYAYSNGFNSLSAGKTVTGLSQGTTVYVEVSQSNNSPADLAAGERRTYLTIHKVG